MFARPQPPPPAPVDFEAGKHPIFRGVRFTKSNAFTKSFNKPKDGDVTAANAAAAAAAAAAPGGSAQPLFAGARNKWGSVRRAVSTKATAPTSTSAESGASAEVDACAAPDPHGMGRHQALAGRFQEEYDKLMQAMNKMRRLKRREDRKRRRLHKGARGMQRCWRRHRAQQDIQAVLRGERLPYRPTPSEAHHWRVGESPKVRYQHERGATGPYPHTSHTSTPGGGHHPPARPLTKQLRRRRANMKPSVAMIARKPTPDVMAAKRVVEARNTYASTVAAAARPEVSEIEKRILEHRLKEHGWTNDVLLGALVEEFPMYSPRDAAALIVDSYKQRPAAMHVTDASVPPASPIAKLKPTASARERHRDMSGLRIQPTPHCTNPLVNPTNPTSPSELLIPTSPISARSPASDTRSVFVTQQTQQAPQALGLHPTPHGPHGRKAGLLSHEAEEEAREEAFTAAAIFVNAYRAPLTSVGGRVEGRAAAGSSAVGGWGQSGSGSGSGGVGKGKAPIQHEVLANAVASSAAEDADLADTVLLRLAARPDAPDAFTR